MVERRGDLRVTPRPARVVRDVDLEATARSLAVRLVPSLSKDVPARTNVHANWIILRHAQDEVGVTAAPSGS